MIAIIQDNTLRKRSGIISNSFLLKYIGFVLPKLSFNVVFIFIFFLYKLLDDDHKHCIIELLVPNVYKNS